MADKEYDQLIEKALDNAIEDRKLAKEAYEQMKDIFDIDVAAPESMQAVMLTGQSAVKLLESMSRSNEQIVKLAQMRQKDKPKEVEEDDNKPFDLEVLKAAMADAKKK